MARSSNYYIVGIPFFRKTEFYERGSAVDTSSWNCTQDFLKSGRLRTPHTIEDWELIIESARGIKKDPFDVFKGGDIQ